MRHLFFETAETYSVAILVKGTGFNKQEILNNYVEPLGISGIKSSEFISFTLKYDAAGKAGVKFMKEYLNKLLPSLKELGVKYLYVADTGYFKVLTKQVKADPHYGYVLPCKVDGFEDMQVVLGLNYQALIYNPDLQAKLTLSLNTLSAAIKGNYVAIGTDIIHSAYYPESLESIAAALKSLHQYPSLTCDIETFSLGFNEAGIATIAFAWDQHNGLAFACDYQEVFDDELGIVRGLQTDNYEVRKLIFTFLLTYTGTVIYHNATFDIKVLIYVLFMQDPLDTIGLLSGLNAMTGNFHDTKILAYLATNSTAGNSLGLKDLAHEFAGNWAVEDIKDVRRVPLKDLLQYNLVDCLSTWYVFNKYKPVVESENQSTLYKQLMLPSLKTIIQMELTGMPMNVDNLAKVKQSLIIQEAVHRTLIENSPIIKVLDLITQTNAMQKANAKLKVKQHPLEKFSGVRFNPNSTLQLQILLYEQMGLPIIDYTENNNPATGADTIKKLINHTQEPEYKALLNALVSYSEVTKILTTFIPAFEEGIDKEDGRKYLHGSFNLGGTVSGRLSSSKPNMQNLPAKSTFGKAVKSCFSAPEGWLFVGADFNSLEDYISALTTKDPNKLAVYEQGFDGHCLRAAYYFRDKCPEIILNDPKSVNSIKTKYEDLRQDSKGPTFALTYQGTWHTLVNNLGFDEEKAKAIEKGYHDLYKVSDQYVQDRLQQASKDGYVEVAFGLRVRTPLLKQVVFGSTSMPYEAAAEGRTAGNALGQSYGLLNSRAANAFMEKVWASKYKLDIKPVALIHDAIYLIVKDDVDVVEWVNKELILAMQWQELPEIQHPTVKLGAALDIYWPDWSHTITLPNHATNQTIVDMCNKAKGNI